MRKNSLRGILEEYDQQSELYKTFTEKVEQLVSELLNQKNSKLLSVTSRRKDKGSLEKKLEREKEKYSKLSDLTDISGVRIITYFADDVDAVAKVIKREFDIDWGHSVDKRATLDPDKFGYVSLHYGGRNAREILTFVITLAVTGQICVPARFRSLLGVKAV